MHQPCRQDGDAQTNPFDHEKSPLRGFHRGGIGRSDALAVFACSGKVLKPAKIATGMEVPVPLFVDQGDKIEIDTRTGEYRKRV